MEKPGKVCQRNKIYSDSAEYNGTDPAASLR